MPGFGDFDTVGEPVAVRDRRHYTVTLWRAQKRGANDGRSYAVKSYAPRRETRPPAGEELEPDGGLKFVEGIKDLRKAGEPPSPWLARVHDFGLTAEGVWYATDFYPRTLEKFITLRGRVDGPGLRHIVEGVVAGCLALKRSRGYSHGNLKTGNVFLVGPPRPLRKTPIHLSDPYPAAPDRLAHLDAAQRQAVGDLLQQTVEANDLRSLGELLVQLVEGRLIRSGENEYPVRDSPAWKSLGREAERWRGLCNRLLDPNLSLNEINLARLALDYRPHPLRAALPALAVVVVLAGLAGGGVHWLRHQVRLIVTVPSASPITYGQTVADSTLTGGVGSVPGSFSFSEPKAVPKAGNSMARVTFTPSDSKLQSVALSVPLVVNKATPRLLTAPSAGLLTYGQSLAEATLSGGAASTPGAFAFQTPAAAPHAGTAAQDLIFTPLDSADFNSLTTNVPVTVNQAIPVVTAMPTVAALPQGHRLAETTLAGGTASTPGTFAFTHPAEEPAQTSPQSVTFTPLDGADYRPVEFTVPVTVQLPQPVAPVITPVARKTPVIVRPPAAAVIAYGQTLEGAKLAGGEASVPGVFAFAEPAAIPPAGTAPHSVIFTPGDTNNYLPVATAVPVTVNRFPVVVTTPPSANAITFGQTLAGAKLVGGVASTAGQFAFVTPSLAPRAGTAGQNVVFTPADAANYGSATVQVAVAVSKAAPRLGRQPIAATITNGQTLAAAALTGGVTEPAGRFAFASPDTQPNATGPQMVIFTPADSSNYQSVSFPVVVTLVPAASRPAHPPISLFGMDFLWVDRINGGHGAYVQKTEISQGVIKANGGHLTQTSWQEGDEYPANLTFAEAAAFCDSLNQKQPGGRFVLPSESDFLIYSGAGTANPNPTTASLAEILRSLAANTRYFNPNARTNRLQAVSDGLTNAFGLIHVLGNAWEWCDRGGAGVPAGFSFVSTGFGPSGRLFGERNPPTPDNDVLGARLLFVPGSAPGP